MILIWDRESGKEKKQQLLKGRGGRKKAPMLVQPASALKSASVPADWSRSSFELTGRQAKGFVGSPSPVFQRLNVERKFTPDLEADMLLTKRNWCPR